MQCSLPLSLWGFVGHLGERYCSECLKIAGIKKKERRNMNYEKGKDGSYFYLTTILFSCKIILSIFNHHDLQEDNHDH